MSIFLIEYIPNMSMSNIFPLSMWNHEDRKSRGLGHHFLLRVSAWQEYNPKNVGFVGFVIYRVIIEKCNKTNIHPGPYYGLQGP